MTIAKCLKMEDIPYLSRFSLQVIKGVKFKYMINQSKSICWNWIRFRDDTVSCRSSLSPNPAASHVIMIKYTPKIIFTSLSLLPIPWFLEFENRTVHLLHVETICEGCELSICSKSVLAHSSSCEVTIDLQSRHRVSQSNNSTCPSLIKRLIDICEGSSSWQCSLL